MLTLGVYIYGLYVTPKTYSLMPPFAFRPSENSITRIGFFDDSESLPIRCFPCESHNAREKRHQFGHGLKEWKKAY